VDPSFFLTSTTGDDHGLFEEDVLRGLQWEECLLYMDDIIVPGSSVEESLFRLEHICIRLREANLKLKPSKCTG
jgi:hypothetical protein